MTNWLVFIILIVFPFVFAFSGNKAKTKKIKNKKFFYLKDIILSVFLLFLIFLLNTDIYKPLDTEKTGRGFNISDDFLSALYGLFFIHLSLSFTPWGNLYPKNISTVKELFGYPIGLLPENRKEYLFFFLYVISGVIFEELFCRQFMFYSFNQVLSLKGDVLLIVSSILFSAGHFYQGWKGIIGSLLIGLILGKIFLLTGNILYPIVLHLASNLTITVLAYKRIKEIRLLKKE